MCKRYMDYLPLACLQLGTWLATQACALTGSPTSDLSVRRPALNPLSHTSQGKNKFSFNFPRVPFLPWEVTTPLLSLQDCREE